MQDFIAKTWRTDGVTEWLTLSVHERLSPLKINSCYYFEKCAVDVMKCPEQHRTACHFNDFVAKRSRELWMNVNFSPVITSFPQHRKNLYKKKEHSGEKQHLETKNESFNRLKVNFYYFIAKSCPWWCPMSCPWCLSSSLRLKGKLFVMDFWFLLDRETNSWPPFIPFIHIGLGRAESL